MGFTMIYIFITYSEFYSSFNSEIVGLFDAAIFGLNKCRVAELDFEPFCAGVGGGGEIKYFLGKKYKGS